MWIKHSKCDAYRPLGSFAQSFRSQRRAPPASRLFARARARAPALSLLLSRMPDSCSQLAACGPGLEVRGRRGVSLFDQHRSQRKKAVDNWILVVDTVTAFWVTAPWHSRERENEISLFLLVGSYSAKEEEEEEGKSLLKVRKRRRIAATAIHLHSLYYYYLWVNICLLSIYLQLVFYYL